MSSDLIIVILTITVIETLYIILIFIIKITIMWLLHKNNDSQKSKTSKKILFIYKIYLIIK